MPRGGRVVGKEESSSTFNAINKSGTYEPATDPGKPDPSAKYGCWIALCIGTLAVVAGIGHDWEGRWNWLTFGGIGILMIGIALGAAWLMRRNS
jgi:hypothetical protein